MSKKKMAGLAVLAVFAFSAFVSSSALALPEFVTKSGTNANYTGTNTSESIFKAKELGTEGTIKCEKATVEGTIVNKSMESIKNVIKFSGKCEQSIGGAKATCSEPVTSKLLLGTLGYIKKEAKGAVGMLLQPETGTVFAEPSCGANNTDIDGAIIGEFAMAQLNSMRTKFTLTFTSTGVKQGVSTLLLLPEAFMEKVSFKTEGFFAGEAALTLPEELTSPEGEIKA